MRKPEDRPKLRSRTVAHFKVFLKQVETKYGSRVKDATASTKKLIALDTRATSPFLIC